MNWITNGMFLTFMSGICLVIIGLAGVFGWDRLASEGQPAEMFMPVTFGVAILICAGFSRVHYRHGLYGGLIMALLGVISATVRLYQYEGLTSFSMAKTQLILAMGVICIIQMIISWREIQKDRNPEPPTV